MLISIEEQGMKIRRKFALSRAATPYKTSLNLTLQRPWILNLKVVFHFISHFTSMPILQQNFYGFVRQVSGMRSRRAQVDVTNIFCLFKSPIAQLFTTM